MTRIIDVDKAQEALDRAAYNALHGSHDVRAGRFVAGDASVSLPEGRTRSRKPRPAMASTVDAMEKGGKVAPK